MTFIVNILTFIGAVVFVAQSYRLFSSFIELINSGSSSFSGGGSEWVGCAYYLIKASGIADGFSSAFSFGIFVFSFLFMHSLYVSTIQVLKILDKQINDALKLV